MRDMLSHLPEIIANIREIKALSVPVDTEVLALSEAVAALLAEQFVETMSAYGCARWEAMLGITPLDTDTLEDRRFRIRTRFNEEPPYSRQVLKKKLDALCGVDGYIIEPDMEGYLFKIRLALARKKQLGAVQELLERMLPVNLRLVVDLLYNTYEKLGAKTYGELSKFTYEELREGVLE